MAQSTTTANILPLLRIFKLIMPVVMGAMLYWMLMEFVSLSKLVSMVVAFGFAVIEWLTLHIVIKRLEKRESKQP